MGVPGLVEGQLPLGRHVCSLKDVHAAFVADEAFASSRTRAPLWTHLEAGVQLLSRAVTVYQLWLGGSFTTGKLDPGDVDVTFLIDGRDHYTRSDQERRLIEAFTVRIPDPVTGEPRAPHGLALDSYVVDWWPFEPAMEEEDQPWGEPAYDTYTANRGYWDDWWLRRRSGEKGNAAVLEDALPRRGFVEVTICDYAI